MTAISLAWIGDCEIRMRAALQADATQLCLFIVDAFDHDRQVFIDSRVCQTIAEGAVAFDDFLKMSEPVSNAPN